MVHFMPYRGTVEPILGTTFICENSSLVGPGYLMVPKLLEEAPTPVQEDHRSLLCMW